MYEFWLDSSLISISLSLSGIVRKDPFDSDYYDYFYFSNSFVFRDDGAVYITM